MKNIKISIRLSALTVFFVVCVLILSSFFISSMSDLNNSSQDIAENWLPTSVSASNINKGLSQYRANEYKHINLTNAAEMKEVNQKMSEIYATVEKEISNVENSSDDDSIKDCIKTIKIDWKNYTEQSQKAIALSTANKKQEAMNILINDSYKAYNSATEVVDKLVELCQQGASAADKFADVQYAQTSRNSIIAIIIAILITVVLNFFLIKSITVPVRKLKEAAEAIAGGNLNVVLDYVSKDEIGDLFYNFNKTVSRLNDYIKYIDEVTFVLDGIAEGNLCFNLKYDYSGEFKKIKTALENISSIFNMTMGNINQSANQVSDGSLQVSDSAQALAQATTEQAGSVEQLVSNMEKISETVDNNAQNAQEAKTLAYSFEKTIEESNNGMSKMTESMDEITETSNEISKIIKLIDDIAFQTNILSLNAAVEAARAGAAGKGFAVVADEVRNLAAKSAEAAKSTSKLIKNSINAVDNGTRIANDTAGTLNSVVTKAKKLINTMNSIAESSESQAEAISQIKDGIEQISNVVQTNSATAEESASISQQLNGQAEVLKNLVGRFKLKADYKVYDVPFEHKIKSTPPLVSESNQSSFSNFDTKENTISFDDDYNSMPNEIILNENDENAYVPEVNLIKNDNGSDKY